MRHLAGIALVMACVLGVAAAAQATTWVVDVGTALNSIQAAIDQAQAGDLVLVHAGFYYERLTLRDGVAIAAQLPGSVFVEGEAAGSVVTAIGVGTTTTVSGLTFRHGSAQQGGGLYAVAASPVFTGCTFAENSAVLGGGVYIRDGSRARFVSCQFNSNLASVGGGLYLDFAPISLSSCTIAANDASDGAAIAASNAAEADVSYTCLHDNRARQGAIVACNLASPNFTNCTAASNNGSLGTFALRGSGTRLERCVVAFNTGDVLVCSGFSSPWVGCNVLWGNATQTICGGDQATNVVANPLFCNLAWGDFRLAANSPAAGGACGAIGSYPVACPAQGVDTPVAPVTWSRVKTYYRD